MTLIVNGGEAGSNGTAVTAGNSGGGGDTAFSSRSIGTGAALTFDNAVKAHGSLSYKLALASGTATFVTWLVSATQIAVRVDVYFDTLPGAIIRFLDIRHSTGTIVRLQTNASNQFQIQEGGTGTPIRYTSGAFSAARHYRWEVVISTIAAGTGAYKADYYDGDSLTSNGGVNITAGQLGTAAIASLNVGSFASSTATSTMHVDDMGYVVGQTIYIGPVLTQIVKSLQALRNVRATVTKSRQFLRNVVNSAITKQVTFLRNVVNSGAPIYDDSRYMYDDAITYNGVTVAVVTKSRTFVRNVAGRVTKTLTFRRTVAVAPSAADIPALILASDVIDSVSAGCELVDANLNVLADISADLLGGTVSRDCATAIQGDCHIQLSNQLAWGSSLVRLFMTLSAQGLSYRWNVGVFSLTTPTQPLGEAPVTYDVQGYDRVSLLNRQIADGYSVAAGTAYLTAVRAVITAAGLSTATTLFDGTSQTLTLPAAMVWPMVTTGAQTTWLDVVNQLLAAINYRPIWADANGYFRSEPFVDPALQSPTYTFDADVNHSIGITNRTLTRDLWAAPNTWIFVQSTRVSGAAAPGVGDGVFVVTNPSNGPSSIAGRGGLAYPQTFQIAAADQATLVELGNAQVAGDLRDSATLAVTTAPYPGAGHYDVFVYRDADLDAIAWQVQATAWRLDLAGADMTWTWRKIGTVS